MLCRLNHWWMMLFVIGFTRSEMQPVCDVCTCDNHDQPIVVDCDSKNLSNLTTIVFNSTIQTLTFVNNSLTFQSDDDLEKINNITSLKELDLSDNSLTNIPALSLVHLVQLRLENTELKSALFPKSFENCSALETIVLSNNKLITLKADELQSLPSLTKLFLDRTHLTSIDRHALLTNNSNGLQSVSLVGNELRSTEFLSNLTNLLAVNLDQNALTKLPEELNSTGHLKQISFRENLIETINESSPLFHWMKANLSGIDVYLNRNPFDCCQSRWFIHYLASPQNLVRDAFNLTCSSPKNYAGQRLIDLPADLMDCSIGPFHPSHFHFGTFVTTVLPLLGMGFVILLVVGLILRQRKKQNRGRRQQEYEPIGHDHLPASI